MAPRREMPRASKENRLVIESQKSLTNFPQEVFNAWQNAGRFPKNFKNFDEMVAAYNASISGGMTPAEARDDLGIKFNAFKKQGDDYILDSRIIRTELDPWTEQLIDLSSGPESGKLEAKRQRREFTFGVPEEQARLAESNLSMPRSPDDPIYYHKGHLWAAADPNIPGSDDAENVWSEIGGSNILHKDKPRFHPSFMEAAGIPRGKAEAYYNRKALESGARRASGLYGAPPQQILDSLDRLIYERAKAIAQYTGKQAYDVWELATDLNFEPQLNEGFPIKNYDQALALANQAQLDRSSGVNPDTWLNQLAGTTSRGDATAQSGRSRTIQKGTSVTKYKTPKIGKSLGRAGRAGGLLAIGSALLSNNPAEAIPVAAETFTPLGDLQGAPEPSIEMVDVGGKLRPLNTDTNTLMDKPGYGLEQSGGQWREVKRGTGVASQQQRQAIPQAQSRPRTATAARTQGQMMPRTQPLNLANEGQYFIVNPIRSAFSNIFGKREI